MPANERKYWPSAKKHEHVLGEVRRVKHGVGEISALYLYEQSTMRGEEPTELPPARIEAMIGASSGIVCTICGERLDWVEPPSEAYVRLVAHYPRRVRDGRKEIA